MATEMPRGGPELGGSGRPALHLHSVARKAMEVGPNHNAVERLHEEFRRRIKTQTVLPSAETAAMLFWALLASGQIAMRKIDGWQTLSEEHIPPCIDLAA